MRIIALFNLKPDADAAAYEEWARTRDMVGVKILPSVKDFAIYRTGEVLFKGGTPPYQYVEIIDIDDLDAFMGDVQTDAVTTLAQEMSAFADDTVFLTTERLPEVA